jgi:hypothetical protein
MAFFISFLRDGEGKTCPEVVTEICASRLETTLLKHHRNLLLAQ